MKHDITHHVTFGKGHYNIAWPEDAHEHIQSFVFHKGQVFACSCLAMDIEADVDWFITPENATVLYIGDSVLSDAVIRACHTNLAKI